jgi:signal transduction histidine kinase
MADTPRITILNVDSAPARAATSGILRQAGFEVTEAGTGGETLRLAIAQPDLIILNVDLPDMSGLEVCRRLKAEGATAAIPVLCLSATEVGGKETAPGLANGADAYLVPPVEPAVLTTTVKALLRMRGAEQALRESEERYRRLVESVPDAIQPQREILQQSEKVAVLGALLAGVAHELNNPLSVVIGHAALLRQAIPAGPLAARVEKLAGAAERCSRILQRFTAVARQRTPEYRETQLNELAAEALELLAYQLGVDDVQVALDLTPDLPLLWADPHQLRRVLVNLVTNAHQAMRDSPPPRRLTLTSRFDPDRRRVSLEVADTGPGIPPAIQARIFEPFFTTKPGQASGLGLAVCQGIVAGHGGSIWVESGAGQGTLFVLELPVRTAPEAASATAPADEGPPVRGKAILVVEDEPDVAELLAEILAQDAHHIETASNGAMALEKIRSVTYDLILSDLRMPSLDGAGLYRELERHHPGLQRRIVFITGDNLSPAIAQFLDRIGVPSLTKPFQPDEVRRVVRERLRALGPAPESSTS